MIEDATMPASESMAARRGAVVTRTAWAVLTIAAAGWFLRALPLIQAGAFGYPIDYDEGVYFSSSALLLKGILPNRDFVFVHPPGLLYFLAPAAWLGILRDPAFGFAASRWLATVVGFANVILIGRIAMRWVGPVAAIVAAAVYATHPVAAYIERGPFLEPALNLACLAVAWIWLGNSTGRAGSQVDERGGGCTDRSVHPTPSTGAAFDSDTPSSRALRRALISGALCGFAASVKMTGGLWLVACLLSQPHRRSRTGLAVLIASAAAVWAALACPAFVASPASFIEQVIWFHAHRPPDGTVGRLDRLAAMFWSRGLLAQSWLYVTGLVFALFRARSRERRGERFFASAFLFILAGFLASSTYWSQYNAHLAVPEAALAGYGGAALWRWASAERTRIRLALVFALLAFVPAWGARRAVLSGRARSPELIALGHFLWSSVPADACLMSFEPAWSVAGGRLPDNGPQVPRLVDSYAAMLLDAARSGQRFADATQAFRDDSSQPTLLRALERCRFAIVAGRGFWQMSPDTQTWFRSLFVQRFPPSGAEGIDVWEHEP
jgi:hypothetical protein